MLNVSDIRNANIYVPVDDVTEANGTLVNVAVVDGNSVIVVRTCVVLNLLITRVTLFTYL